MPQLFLRAKLFIRIFKVEDLVKSKYSGSAADWNISKRIKRSCSRREWEIAFHLLLLSTSTF